MATTYFYDWQKKLEIPGRVAFLEGNGGLPKVEVTTGFSTAEIYLNGATLTHFQKKGDEPLLFLSRFSRFEQGQPIRGGIPVIFPWFGPREGQPSHGFVRQHNWELFEIATLTNGAVRLLFRFPDHPESALVGRFKAAYSVVVGETLTCELAVTNRSPDQKLEFENCLHTYFQVGDIKRVKILGLQNTTYIDKVRQFARDTESRKEITISEEVDRVYLDTTNTVEIVDESLRRKVRVEKSGGASTVIWNPWSKKAQEMPDFGNEEYEHMVCVESGNIDANKVSLAPEETAALKLKLISNPL